MKTKNIFEDAIENCIWFNPYCALYKYNIKLYKRTFTRMFKSVHKDASHDRDKRDDKDIPAGGHDICNHLSRYDVINNRDKKYNSWQRKQI